MSGDFLLRVSGGDVAATLVVASAGATIGRAAENQLRLADSTVSSRHGRIDAIDGRLAYRDLGSNNGTLVDGTRVLRDATEPLRPGLVLQLGRVQILVEFRAAVTPPEAPVAPAPAPAPAPAQPKRVDSPSRALLDSKPVPALAPADAPAQRSREPESATLASFGQDVASDVASRKALAALGARLVIVTEIEARAIAIDRTPFEVGRSAEVHGRIQNRGVSNRHARIAFDPRENLLRVEDLDSSNGTRVGRVSLSPNQPYLIDADSFVRIGTVDAVLLQDRDSDLREIAPDVHDRALLRLERTGRLERGGAKRLRKRSMAENRHVGEIALIERLVAPKDWAEACEAARSSAGAAVSDPKWRVAILLGIAVVAIVVAVLAASSCRAL